MPLSQPIVIIFVAQKLHTSTIRCKNEDFNITIILQPGSDVISWDLRSFPLFAHYTTCHHHSTTHLVWFSCIFYFFSVDCLDSWMLLRRSQWCLFDNQRRFVADVMLHLYLYIHTHAFKPPSTAALCHTAKVWSSIGMRIFSTCALFRAEVFVLTWWW